MGIAAYTAFIVAGFTEELGKFLAVRQTLYKSPYFSEPMDGLIFAAAAALGFASIENVGYMVSFGAAVVLLRGVFSTVGHVLFAAPWGFALGRQKRGGPSGALFTRAALVVGITAHGLFDFFIFVGGRWAAGTLALFLVGLAGLFYLVALGRCGVRTAPQISQRRADLLRLWDTLRFSRELLPGLRKSVQDRCGSSPWRVRHV